jgi:hypothetical protein
MWCELLTKPVNVAVPVPELRMMTDSDAGKTRSMTYH